MEIMKLNLIKLKNRESNSDFKGPFSFMALIKDNNNIKLFSSKYKFDDGQISLDSSSTPSPSTIELLESKTNTKGYFDNNNNSFYYFTYNDVSDFSSGYSINPPGDDYTTTSVADIQ